MAKGNDGNLLQHAVECEIIRTLQAQQNFASLELISTHGMAPFDPVTDAGRPATKLFQNWLDVGTGKSRRFRDCSGNKLPAFVIAYRKSRATYFQYPKTGELVAALVGRQNIGGHICEFNPEIANTLAGTWGATGVSVHHGDWREVIGSFANRSHDSHWLMTMDPMTFDYRNRGQDFGPRDFHLVEDCIRRRVDSDCTGCFCFFCYLMSQQRLQEFRQCANEFANRLNLDPCFVHMNAANGRDHQPRTHLGMLISNQPDLLTSVEAAWERIVLGPGEWH